MKNLRYMAAIVAAMFIAGEASAWTAEVNKAILLFAEQNMSKKTQREVVEILDAPLHSIVFAGESQTRLNEVGKSVTTDENDAVVKLERAIANLSDKKATAAERKAALLTVVEMTVDIHCPSNILIDKHLEKDFKFGRDNGRPKKSRWFKIDEKEWRKMWHRDFHSALGAFSAEMYLYDWHIATKGMAKRYKKEPIAPRQWAEQTGEVVLEALKTFKPDSVVDRMAITALEEVNNSAMYDAAFRLANMLNTILK